MIKQTAHCSSFSLQRYDLPRMSSAASSARPRRRWPLGPAHPKSHSGFLGAHARVFGLYRRVGVLGEVRDRRLVVDEHVKVFVECQ